MPDPLLDAEAIRSLLAEVADEFEAIAEPGSERPEVVVVGGAMLALHGLRSATHDVDSVRPVPSAPGGPASLDRPAQNHPSDRVRCAVRG